MSELLAESQGEFSRAEHLLQLKRYEDAIPVIGSELAKDPQSYMAHYQMARAFLGLEDYNAASHHCEIMISEYPDAALGYFIKSCVEHEKHNFVDELRLSEQAANLEPEDIDILRRLTHAQMQNGLLKKAKETVEQLVLLAPDDMETHELMGDICFELKDYFQAKKHYEAALEFDPENAALVNDLARCYIGLKQRKEAIDTMYNALRMMPDSELLRSNLFRTIQSFLDREKLKGKAALKSLPDELQYFYSDFKGRTSFFQRHGSVFWGAMWILFLAAMIGFFSTVT